MPTIVITFIDFYTGALLDDGIVVNFYTIDPLYPSIANPNLFVEQEIVGSGTATVSAGQVVTTNLQLLTEYLVTFTGTNAPSGSHYMYTRYLNQTAAIEEEEIITLQFDVLFGMQGPPGPQGIPGAGPSVTTATFTLPATGVSVTTSVENTSAFTVGSSVFISDGITSFIGTVLSLTSNSLTLEVEYICSGAVGNIVNIGAFVTFAGRPGPQGEQGEQGTPGTQYQSGYSNVIRDMAMWYNFTPGLVVTQGSLATTSPNNTNYLTNLLNINTTTGDITFTLPEVPTGFLGWLVTLEAILEAQSPISLPNSISSLTFTMTTTNHTGTVYFEDIDWGNFIAQSAMNQTVTNKLHGAYGPGATTLNISALGVATQLIQTVGFTNCNRKIHFLLDAVAY